MDEFKKDDITLADTTTSDEATKDNAAAGASAEAAEKTTTTNASQTAGQTVGQATGQTTSQTTTAQSAYQTGGYTQTGTQGYAQGGYSSSGYTQGSYSQGGYSQSGNAQGYAAGGYRQSGYGQGGYSQNGYGQNGYTRGGYAQTGAQGYTQGGAQGYAQGGYRSAETNRLDMGHIPPEPSKTKKKGGIWKKILLALILGLAFGLFFGLGFLAVKSVADRFTITSESSIDSVPILPNKPKDDDKKQDDKKEEKEESVDAEAETEESETEKFDQAEMSDSTIGSTAAASATVLDVSQVAENCMPSIVSITELYTQTYRSIWGEAGQVQNSASGSGVIVGENETELLIVTNNHVVEDADELTVQFVDGNTYDAQVKGTDADTDLAIIAIDKSALSSETKKAIRIATLGDSTTLKVGEPAIAIGNALGYGQSVTCGVISALDRELPLDGVAHSVIQTDAAINPGNSGGALLNIRGELIGINEAKLATTTVEGMGYAIPISTAKPIIEELMSKETKKKVEASKSAYLGIGGVDVTDEISKMYSMPKGVYINQIVEGSAADKCGLQRGDVITEFDGQEVYSMEELRNMLQYYSAGTEVDLEVQRVSDDGYEGLTISVTLGKKTES